MGLVDIKAISVFALEARVITSSKVPVLPARVNITQNINNATAVFKYCSI
jgi:hypothetical protein